MPQALGRYVQVDRCLDGTDRIFHRVPPRLRPDGWPAQYSLPLQGNQVGRLSNLGFLARIVKDAKLLNEQLDARRAKQVNAREQTDHSVRAVYQKYLVSTAFDDLSPTRKNQNRTRMGYIVQWFDNRGNPDINTLTADDVDEMLQYYNDRPSQRTQVHSAFHGLFRQAARSGWRTDNPAKMVKWRVPKPTTRPLWDLLDVAYWALRASEIGQPGLSAFIWTNWYLGQRCGDLREARYGKEYHGDGLFTIKQRKTGETVEGSLPVQVVKLIEEARLPNSGFVFNDSFNQTKFTQGGLSTRFLELKNRFNPDADFTLNRMRHSMVVDSLLDDINPYLIANVTGHTYVNVDRIMERYALRQPELGQQAITKRHISMGGTNENFAKRPDRRTVFRARQADSAPFKRTPLDLNDVEASLKRMGIRIDTLIVGHEPSAALREMTEFAIRKVQADQGEQPG